MFSRSDLDTLMADVSPHAVSLYLPTHVLGAEIREEPIRLKNLIAEARAKLLADGLTGTAADALLSPAAALVEDYQFWQHQDQGLALFLGDGEPRFYRVPLRLPEQVIVGRGFRIMGLLPVLAADGYFFVCTLTEDEVHLFQASRHAMTEVDLASLPASLPDSMGADSAESDYQNPVQASPVARPHTASVNISNAQVYGDSPPEWRKGRLLEFTRKAASAIDRLIAAHPAAVVLVANSEIAGHVQKASKLGSTLAVIDANPAAFDQDHLHALAYATMRPRLDQVRIRAVDQFATLYGRQDPRAVTDPDTILTMAGQGRIDTLLLTEDNLSSAEDEPTGHALEEAATQTLQQGGTVHLVSPGGLPGAPAGAVLRY